MTVLQIVLSVHQASKIMVVEILASLTMISALKATKMMEQQNCAYPRRTNALQVTKMTEERYSIVFHKQHLVIKGLKMMEGKPFSALRMLIHVLMDTKMMVVEIFAFQKKMNATKITKMMVITGAFLSQRIISLLQFLQIPKEKKPNVILCVLSVKKEESARSAELAML